jgi:gliding motility-associated lipoprotein GldH
MMKTPVFIVIMLIVLSACHSPKEYEEFITIPGQTWSNKNILHFNVNITDTTTAQNVLISVRNSGKYAYSNLYLFVTAHSPNGAVARDTVEIMLADERGKWLGRGAASIFTLYYPYRINIRFPLPGIYTFDVEQAMWIKELKDINDIGLRIEKAGLPQ